MLTLIKLLGEGLNIFWSICSTALGKWNKMIPFQAHVYISGSDVVCNVPDGAARAVSSLIFLSFFFFLVIEHMWRKWAKHKSGNSSLLSSLHHLVLLSDAQQSFLGCCVLLFTHLKPARVLHMQIWKNMKVYFRWYSKRYFRIPSKMNCIH